MLVSAWHDGHGSYGVRVVERSVSLWFRPEWRWVTVWLPNETAPAAVPLTESFWTGSPELRSARFKALFERHGFAPWPHQRPPHFELEPLGGGVFRLKWLERLPGQPTLWAAQPKR